MDTPYVFSWMSNEAKGFREEASANFKLAAELNGEKVVDFEFLDGGHADIVVKYQTHDGFKICKLAHVPLATNAVFYKKCSEVGISVPQVFNHIEVKPGVYALFMSFIDAPILGKTPKEELLREGQYFAMGKILALINSIKGQNFGIFDENLVGYTTDFLTMIQKPIIEEAYPDIQASKFINEKANRKLVDQASQYLASQFDNGLMPSLCHNDLHVNNVFYTNPLTIFDPFTNLSHSMLDLAMTLLYASVGKLYLEIRREIMEGYQSIGEIDHKALDAGLIMLAFRKSATAIRKKNESKEVAYGNIFNEAIKRWL